MGLKFSIPYQIPFYETDITHQENYRTYWPFHCKYLVCSQSLWEIRIRTFLINTVWFGL